MNIARVFPRKTKATPTDRMAFYDTPPLITLLPVDEVHVSVTFTYDMEHAEYLAYQWEVVAPVKIGGVAFGKPSGEFQPGMYLKQDHVITSRGCPNKCWFCSVWKREPTLIELSICNGWNVLDDNLLACSENHIRNVFAMLMRQPHRAEFTGGLEAKLLKDWHVDLLYHLRPKQMFFAYDTPDDFEPLIEASKKLIKAGFNNRQMRCYVLIGHPKDTMENAERRLHECLDLGFFPMAMLWRDNKGNADHEWAKFQRKWARPAIISKQ